MKEESNGRELKVGKTTVKLADIVRDPTGIEDVIIRAVTDERLGWAERRLQQIGVRLNFFASAGDLKEWDKVLLERYEPLYMPDSDFCHLCTLGPCNLVKRKGACGITIRTKMAKESLIKSCRGSASYLSEARDLVDMASKRFPPDHEISHGINARYPSINPSVLTGFDIYTLEHAETTLRYAEKQLSELTAAAAFGAETDVTELEEKALHAGSIALLAAEVTELIKESCLGLCSASNKNLVELPNFPYFIQQGVGSVDTSKPVVLFAGNSLTTGVGAVDYIKTNDLADQIEICGSGAPGLDIGRYYEGTKNIGTATKLLKAIRIGLPDVLVAGDQCVSMSIVEECQKIGAPLIMVNKKMTMGFKDRTEDDAETLISDLAEGKVQGVLIEDSAKAAMVAVEVSRKKFGTRGTKFLPELATAVEACLECGSCENACPNDLPLLKAMTNAKAGNYDLLSGEVYPSCLCCTKCEGACPQDVPVMSVILKAAESKIKEEDYNMRPGRGTPAELEFRDVAFAFGFGSVSGIVAIVGCGGNAGDSDDVGFMANKLIELNYLVTTAGCAATDMAGYYNDYKKRHLYEAWNGLFQIEGIVNCGSCSALSHIARGFYKYTHVIARTPMMANFTEQADYIFGKLPCAVIMWGPVTEKMYAMASGYARLGATVVMGPHGTKYNRFLMGNVENREKWWCYDGFTGRKNEVEPCPPHLIVPVETKEEALVMVTRLLFRTNDFRDGRISKFDSYLTMYEDYFNKLPEDFHKYVRSDAELPWTKKHKLLRILREKYGWETEKGTIIRAKHPDGRLLPPEEFAEEYGIRVGQYSTFLERLILKEEARGTELNLLKQGGH